MARTLFIFMIVSQIGFSQTWSGEVGDSLWNPSSNSIVFSLNNFENTLVVSGAFTSVGSLTVNAIAKWDGENWYVIGSGATMGTPNSVGKIDSLLVAGGNFYEMGNTEGTRRLAIWDGVIWQGPSIGEVGFVVYDIDIFDNKLFIGGEFSNIGSYTFDKIAAFDGTNWINVGSCGSWVRTLEVYNGELYAGGYFGIKKFNGTSSWTVPYGGVDGRVMVMKTDTFNNFLYVGGSFDYVGDDTLSSCAAMWDGFSWNSLGYVINCDVMAQAMEIYRGDLYVGGCFETLYNGLNVNYIARWDGEQWNKVGNGFDAYVSAMGTFQDELYVGGYFTYVDDTIRAYGLARWHMPDTSCNYIKPRVQTLTDTFYLNS
ncbi:MAG: hypothetical protein JXR58_00405, partial [Bacteroidales bacterium]|nr:hypothetical protein [Bacteroidales bacterium]